jgi:hypothetical protein
MAGDWIKCSKSLFNTHPEIAGIAERLHVTTHEAIGRVLHVWCWIDTHYQIDEPDPEKTVILRNARVTLRALQGLHIGANDTLQAMSDEGWWLVEGDEIHLHHFARHNGKSGKARALGACRQKRFRNARVTLPALPEKRREEKIEEKTPLPPTGGGEDGDLSDLVPVSISAALNGWIPGRWGSQDIQKLGALIQQYGETAVLDSIHTAADTTPNPRRWLPYLKAVLDNGKRKPAKDKPDWQLTLEEQQARTLARMRRPKT